jgi:5'-deoxynucleotidase YfbR-like HD superfamily hydrolase
MRSFYSCDTPLQIYRMCLNPRSNYGTIIYMAEEIRFTRKDLTSAQDSEPRGHGGGILTQNRDSCHSDYSVDPAVEVEVNAILWSAQLSSIRRFHWQPYWEEESGASDKALQIEAGVPLENVAEHSWKVADMAMQLYHLVPNVNRTYCLELALLHDKLELITGDYSPIDEDATGQTTHAFNKDSALAKKEREHVALEKYLLLLPEPVREYQRRIIEDAIEVRSDEAKFVNALDKLAAVAYIVIKKPCLREEHLDFTTRYSGKAMVDCPALVPHHSLLISMLKGPENASA